MLLEILCQKHYNLQEQGRTIYFSYQVERHAQSKILTASNLDSDLQCQS